MRCEQYFYSIRRIGLQGEAQAHGAALERAGTEEAVRHTGHVGSAVPASATVHVVRTPISGASRVDLRLTRIVAEQVPYPLVHIAAHVIDVQLIGLQRTHGYGCRTRDITHVGDVVAAGVLGATAAVSGGMTVLSAHLGAR